MSNNTMPKRIHAYKGDIDCRWVTENYPEKNSVEYVRASVADEMRRQRDEALQVLRALTSHKDSKLSTDVEYIGIYQRAQRILAQYTEDTE